MIPQPDHNKTATVAVGSPAGRTHLLSWALVIGLIALGVLFFFSDARKLWETASTVDARFVLLPFLCGVASYALMALSYHGIAEAAGAEVPFWEMLKITFVANTVNYVVSTGGLSGFAVRLYFFIRCSIPSGTAVIISLVQTFITNTILLLFVVGGFAYLLGSHELHGYALGTISVLLFFFVLAAAVAMVLLLHRGLRRRTLFLAAEAAHWFLHRFLPRHKPARVRIWRFQRNLNRGIEFVLERKRRMILPTIWIVVDWGVTMLILYTAFITVRYPIPMSFVVVGFAVGIILSLVSFVPGGLGVMEGSMAAIFASLSVPFETAVVAVLIFRVAYYLLPMVISVFFFRGMLLQARAAPAALEGDSRQ
ncbi:MAG TPA: flippase-like domain-containing protein [Candidatus Margulisiibacteriota bacterium]|nr:flippase-like domain-containing protein [Candidatus Margulisiibacteriota bacterium]